MHVVVPSDILATVSLLITAGAVLLSAGIGMVLGYHWYRFGMSPLATVGTLGLYAAGCVILIALLYTIGSGIRL